MHSRKMKGVSPHNYFLPALIREPDLFEMRVNATKVQRGLF
jgi:hypothetical protein